MCSQYVVHHTGFQATHRGKTPTSPTTQRTAKDGPTADAGCQVQVQLQSVAELARTQDMAFAVAEAKMAQNTSMMVIKGTKKRQRREVRERKTTACRPSCSS